MKLSASSRSWTWRIGVMAVVLVTIASAFPLAALASGAPPSSPLPAGAVGHPSALVRSHPSAPLSPSSSGVGSFFRNNPVPLPTQPNCLHPPRAPSGVCMNITNEPSINFTSQGVLVMAFTAFTNVSGCANVSNYVGTQVGFVRSTDLGATWSTPTYLANRDCAVASQYPSAYEPSLTSLGNGTLALVYIQYNLTDYLSTYGGSYYWAAFAPWSTETNTPSSRMVFTKSYDNGTTWTTPVALNTSIADPNGSLNVYPPQRPWISAMGKTVYITWENMTQSALYPQSFYPNWAGAGSIGSHLLVSINSGATWRAPIDLPVTPGIATPFVEHVAMNPTVLASTNGRLFVSYATNVSYSAPGCSPTICNQNPLIRGDVVVGTSANNGTTFTWSTVTHGIPLSFTNWGPTYDPSPQLAYSAITGQLYVTFAASEVGTFCYPGFYASCQVTTTSTIFFANSSNLGVRWSPLRMLSGGLINAKGGYTSALWNPSIAVDGTGRVHLEAAYGNVSACGGNFCSVQQQLYWNSSDNGSTFTSPLVLSGNYTIQSTSPLWDGHYISMVAAGSRLWLAYVQNLCEIPGSPACSYLSNSWGRAQVTVAMPYHGTGSTLNFTEIGLPAGQRWTVDLLGNLRSAIAPANVSFSGVPPAETMNWSVPWVNASYGVAFTGTSNHSAPIVVSTATTVVVRYAEQVLVTIRTLPAFTSCYFGTCVNYAVTPSPGSSWVPVGTVITASASPVPPSCAGYCSYLNVSFLGWSGSGNGSVSSKANSVTFTANGQVNETASFLPNAYCQGFSSVVTCSGNLSETVTFNETGLPAGVAWSVFSEGITATSTTTSLSLNVPNGTVSYVVWTVPNGLSTDWVATPDHASPIQLPYISTVNLTFSAVTLASQAFPVMFTAVGLPSGTNWTANLSGLLFSLGADNVTEVVQSGTYTFTSPTIYLTNGTGYTVQSITETPFVMNSSGGTFGTSVRFALDGAVALTVQFQPSVEVSVIAGSGGSAGPATTWVIPGNPVTVNETPNAGFSFAGWAGYGPGATGTSSRFSRSPTIFPTGPVTEVATFVPTPASRFTATFVPAGLPVGQAFTVSLGAQSASGTTSVKFTGLLAGYYPVVAQTTYANGTNGTRFLAVSVTGDPALLSNGTLNATANVTLTVQFATEYLVTVSSTGGGSATPPGATWVRNLTVLNLTASPSAGNRFIGWTGSGNGAYSGNRADESLMVLGSVTEVAAFAPIQAPPTYSLTLIEAGLPGGTPWSFSAGSTGVSGTGTSLVLSGLNGVYAVTAGTVTSPIPGVRYVSNFSAPTTILANMTIPVAFNVQYLVTIASTVGGSASPTGATWYAPGATVMVVATVGASETFAGWSGTGAGSVNANTTTIHLVVSGPTSELASFAPAVAPPSASTSSSGSSNAGLPIALGLLVLLLVVGLVVGYLVFRRRSPPGGVAEWDSGTTTTYETEEPPAN